jgi:hypothetical protein
MAIRELPFDKVDEAALQRLVENRVPALKQRAVVADGP